MQPNHMSRRNGFIGGSDARTIMGNDEAALQRLWREKRGETEPEDLSGNLLVQLGLATEHLNRQWYERTTGQGVKDVQSWVRHPVLRWMAATLDGMVEGTGAVFEAKFMLPWSFSVVAVAEKHMPQLQHNMWVTASRTAVVNYYRGRAMGRNQNPGRSALPTSAAHRREEVLALRREWRDPCPVRRRAASSADRGGADRRYEFLQFLGGICRDVLPDSRGLPRS